MPVSPVSKIGRSLSGLMRHTVRKTARMAWLSPTPPNCWMTLLTRISSARLQAAACRRWVRRWCSS